LKFQHQNSEIFCPILLKNIKISNVYNFGNTGPITKIPTLLSSEAWDLSPYQILWILEKVRWKIPVFLDHLTWNDSLPLCEEVGIRNFAVESESDILSMTLQPWVQLGSRKLRCHFWCYNNNIRSNVFRSFFDVWCLRYEFDVENNFHGVSNSFLIF